MKNKMKKRIGLIKFKKNIYSLFFVVLLFLIQGISFAEDVQVEVSPQEPVVNESFFVTFRIKTSGDSEPYISFNPSGVQVLGKREQGVSIQTTVINGKFTSTKEQSVVYELVAERSGNAILRNVKVELNGKSQDLKDVRINVLSAPKKMPGAFMEAQVSKTRVYVGEGIDVNYYLYFKESITANDVKDFPKLNKFIKRFHHINSPVETVQYKGEIFKRILTYSARLYPEKVGSAVIDPMKISVQVIEMDYNGLGGFGFGAQRVKNKELASNRVEIEVLPLPADNVPAGFTGLVGEHDFTLIPGKDKYLVNEPIEMKLEVKGKGALEKMDAPSIYNDQNLESFDTKSEVTEVGNNIAKKLFEYTYLARSALSIPERVASFAYFDPNSGHYVEKKVTIPGFVVSGVAVTNNSSEGSIKQSEENEESKNTQRSSLDSLNTLPDFGTNFLSRWFLSDNKNGKAGGKSKNQLGLVGPIFNSNSLLMNNIFKIANLILFGLVLVLGYIWFKKYNGEDVGSATQNAEAKNIFKKIKSKGIEHSDLYRLVSMIDKNNKMALGGVSIFNIIEESDLSNSAKQYFKNALELCEQKGYANKKITNDVKFESKYFSELMKRI